MKTIEEIKAFLQEEIEASQRKLVVLDDDPTGTQTMHDITVYTDWGKDSIRKGFEEKNKLFYILTNSRAMQPEETETIHREIVDNILWAAKETGKDFMIISRSDSTLRGHYPLETTVIRERLQAVAPLDGEFICPFFLEGGRLTIQDVHYVKEGDRLIPAAETEFARDEVFGYTHSNLREYIEEKHGGAFKADDVLSISLDEIRALDVDAIQTKLMGVENFGKVIVNAETYDDLSTFALALYRAMAAGKRFVGRTAASIVKTLGGITDVPLLTREKLCGNARQVKGLIVAGSYTEKTTRQLNEAMKLPQVEAVEFHSMEVLNDDAFRQEISQAAGRVDQILQQGKTALIYTGRKRICFDDDTKEDILARSVKISDGLQELVKQVKTRPDFIIAKGGITSSDIAVKAMGIRSAHIAGQIKPGIPVWRSKEENAFHGIPYVVFPGNVGQEQTLKEILEVFL